MSYRATFFIVQSVLLPLGACSYDYNRFHSEAGGAGTTETPSSGGMTTDTSSEGGQGGSASRTPLETDGGASTQRGGTGGVTNTDSSATGGTSLTDTDTNTNPSGGSTTTASSCESTQLSDCSGTCVDLLVDDVNCGACGHRCTGALVCIAGVCGCKTTIHCGSTNKAICTEGLCVCDSIPCSKDQSCIKNGAAFECAALAN